MSLRNPFLRSSLTFVLPAVLWCVSVRLTADEPKKLAEPSSKPAPLSTSEPDDADAAIPDDAATAELFARLEKEQAEEKKALKKQRAAAPFQQTEAIALPADHGRVLGFCVTPSGSLAVISGAGDRYGESGGGVFEAIWSALVPAAKTTVVKNRVQRLDSAGKPVKSAELDFKPLAVNAAPDGSLYVVGDGKIAVFDAQGEKTAQVDSPHLVDAIKDRKQFETDVLERHAAELESLNEQVAQYRDAFKEIEAKPEAERSNAERQEFLQSKMLLTVLESSHKASAAKTPEVVVREATERMRQLHRVAVSSHDLFLVTNESSGYGYCVWRLDRSLKSAKKIVSGLSGCCGQMDIQICEAGLSIAENSRHRVLIVDRDGKTVSTFGQTSRTDVTQGFGSCCNPMNTCLAADGRLLTSESNGLVKCFRPDGEFVSTLGVAKVVEGCKNSSIGISPQGDRIYYFDSEKGRILVLTKKI